MGIRLIGSTGGLGEVGGSLKALRVTQFPYDYGSLGAYSAGVSSAIMAAGLASAAPIVSFRYGGANLAVIKRIELSMGGLGTAFTAGQATFNLFAARSFTVNDTGGAAATLTTNNNKLRTSFGTTGLSDLRASSTATLTAGTRTKDATPLKTISLGIGTTASLAYVPMNTPLFGADPNSHPLVLAQNEGWVIEATVPATGTWAFSCNVEWTEMATTAF